MILEGFIQGTSDEELLKSLPTENISEDLVKAMNKVGLVQKEVQVKGKNGQTFTRKQWVRASDAQSTEPTPQSKQAISKDNAVDDETTKSYSGDDAVDKVCNLKSGSVIEITTKLKDGSTVTGEYTLQTKKYALGTSEAWVKTGGNHYQSDFAPNKTTVKDIIGSTRNSVKIKKAAGEQVQPTQTKDKKNPTKAPAKGYVMEFKTGSTYEYLYTEKPTLTSAKEAYERFHGKPAPKYSTATKHGNQIKIDSDTVKNHCVNISGNDYITSSELSSSKQQDSQPDKGGYKNGSVDKDGNLVAGDKSSLTDLVEEITGTGMFDAKDLADEKISSELQKTSHYDGHFIESMEYESARLVGNKVEIHGRVYGDIDLDDGDKEPFDKTVTFSIPVKSSKSAAPSNASTQDKDKINHNTGVQDKPKSSVLEDYFTGNHGHSDSKSALVALLGKGYSRQDIMSQAEKSGITWKKNDHEGINWMRASMAIQKAWKKG